MGRRKRSYSTESDDEIIKRKIRRLERELEDRRRKSERRRHKSRRSRRSSRRYSSSTDSPSPTSRRHSRRRWSNSARYHEDDSFDEYERSPRHKRSCSSSRSCPSQRDRNSDMDSSGSESGTPINEDQAQKLSEVVQSAGENASLGRDDTQNEGKSQTDSTKESSSGDKVDLNTKNSLSAQELEMIGERMNPDRILAPKDPTNLVIRIKEIIKRSLPTEEKKSLLTKFPLPKNCLFLDPPKLNAELEAALQETQAAIIKRDLRIMETQQRITAGLGGLMSLASLALTLENEKKLQMLEIVSGVLRIFSDLQFEESSIRRSLVSKNIDTSLRETFSSTEVDEWLFSTNLEDRVKAVKALTTASGVLKAKRQSAQNTQAKNSQGPLRRQAARRQSNPAYPTGSTFGGQRTSTRGQRQSRKSQRQAYRGARR